MRPKEVPWRFRVEDGDVGLHPLEAVGHESLEVLPVVVGKTCVGRHGGGSDHGIHADSPLSPGGPEEVGCRGRLRNAKGNNLIFRSD